MYNLLEYGKNYQKTSESLFNYYRDEPKSDVVANNDGDINVSIRSLSLFDYKTKITGSFPAVGNDKEVTIAIPLKHLGNFWSNLDIPLINCEITLNLTWYSKCALVGRAYRAAVAGPPVVNGVESPTDVTFRITDCKLYLPVVTLSAKNDNKLLEQLKSGSKRTIKWNKYMSQISTEPINNNLNYLIDPTFKIINRLFVLSFENENDRTSYYKYYVHNVEIKDYNVLIDGKAFFELPVKSLEETYEKITQITDPNGYFARGNLFDFKYFKEHYKLIAIDLSKQIDLGDKELLQQINFIGKLDRADGAFMFFIIEKKEETVIEFSIN